MDDLESHASKSNSDSLAIFLKAHCFVTLKFEEVVYKIKSKKGRTRKERVILKGITGMVSPGEMLAILGPSGSGKTTLLTALGGRLGGDLAGNITYNGKPFANVMQRNTGFVTQDDVLYHHLTVTETLVFTALLRLPNTITKDEKIMHAETFISQLGLLRCKNSVIGGPMLRGISGGERKRVSIGQEMLINPSLPLLDEPTSGLDSTTAQRIVSTLWELAKGGRTVAMTIHQPSSRLFYMFHKVLLLSEGNPLYFGEGGSVMDYFSSIGYSPSVAMNPSDFLLDLANAIWSDEPDEDMNTVKEDLVSAYKINLDAKLKSEIQNGENFEGLIERKHEAYSKLKIGEVLIVSFLCGLLWRQSDISNLQDQIGLLFFSSSFWAVFPLFQAIFTFPQERTVLEKERASGMYKLSSYFMARTVGDLPMELVLPTVFVIITYWMAGLKPTASNFLANPSVILYNVLVCQGMGLAVDAVVMNIKSATMLGSVIMLSFHLAGGYFVQHVPSFISWIKHISISNYSYILLLGSQYKKDEKYPCGNGLCLIGDYPGIKVVGLDGQVFAVIVMGMMLVSYRLIAYIALTRMGKTR